MIRQYKWWGMSVMAGVILWGLLLFILYSGYNQKKQTYLQAELDSFGARIHATLWSYEKFSDYIFHRIVNQPEIVVKMAHAAQGNPAQQQVLREDLYHSLAADYALMQSYDFRQLHFHLPDGNSFLRFHAPDQYGDNLVHVRDSIRICMMEQRPVFGFEEGRVFNGYRFVYPFFYQGTYVGSVEVSISMAALITALHDLYPEDITLFVLDQAVVRGTVWMENQDNYEEHPVLKDFMLDREVAGSQSRLPARIPEATVHRLLREVKTHHDEDLAIRRDFNVMITKDRSGSLYLVQFLAIRNISGKPVAYFIGISENIHAQMGYGSLHWDMMLTSLFFAMVFGSGLIYFKKQAQLETLSSTDKLTGIFNRHKFLELSERELDRHARYHSSLSLILLDIDHFKKINDTFGHNAGDTVLQKIAEILSGGIRKQDILARWGGEEFVLILPETAAPEAVVIAERLRQKINAHRFDSVGSVSVSLGVACPGETISCDALIHIADQAMYQAKQSGRNRVCCDAAC